MLVHSPPLNFIRLRNFELPIIISMWIDYTERRAREALLTKRFGFLKNSLKKFFFLPKARRSAVDINQTALCG